LDAVIDSPVGRLGVSSEAGGLSTVVFLPPSTRRADPVDAVARQAVQLLRAFFRDPEVDMRIALHVSGTQFQRRVWHALRRIDVGTVCTYGELARRLGTSPRAVGNACRANPVPIIVPCHRVVAGHGMGGFAGHGAGRLIGIKSLLLRHEGVEI
jgi:methylated-DNA-[protein]-cysteine S-methyltransferase